MPSETQQKSPSQRRHDRSDQIHAAPTRAGSSASDRTSRSGSAGQAFAALAVAVAPDHPHAEGRRRMGVPRVRRLERDCRWRNAEPIDGELVHVRVRLVDADLLDREDRIEQRLQPSALTAASSIAGEPFDRIAVRMPAAFNAPRTSGTSGNGIEREVELHQPVAKPGRVEASVSREKVERVAGDLPEIRVASLSSAQPRVLQLLVAPEGREPVDVVAERVAAAFSPPRQNRTACRRRRRRRRARRELETCLLILPSCKPLERPVAQIQGSETAAPARASTPLRRQYSASAVPADR